MKCGFCGFLIDDSWFICPKCGKKLYGRENSDFTDNIQNSAASKRKPVFACRNFNSFLNDISKKEYSASLIDLEEIKKHSDFLKPFDDEQKKAIVAENKRLLCIAGAGSGKTTVLTKKIEYLVKFKNINPKNILAITFTRKAAKELKDRLKDISEGMNISTFNSFCESNLMEYEHFYYSMPQRMLSEEESKKLLKSCITEIGADIKRIIELYFDIELDKEDSNAQEFIVYYSQFLDDIISIIDYIKNENKDISHLHKSLSFFSDFNEKKISQLIYDIIVLYENKKKYVGLRDYSDQIFHFFSLLKTHPEIKKKFQSKFTHIFVDEFQDVNTIQVKLLDELLTENTNLFVVGDPRQSIFGFRGSNVDYILTFPKKYTTAEVVFLNSNYRSSNLIVNIANKSIHEMNLPDLKCALAVENESDVPKMPDVPSMPDMSVLPNMPNMSNSAGNSKAYIIQCENKEKEAEFVSLHVKRLINEGVSPKDIFVLARTNFQIDYLKKFFDAKGILFEKKSIDSIDKNDALGSKKVILSTIHAIKGLEAKVVFVIGMVSGVFPSFSKEKEILQKLKDDICLDSDDEELRLFYVALTRAKEMLYLTYYSRLRKNLISPLVTNEVLLLLKKDKY